MARPNTLHSIESCKNWYFMVWCRLSMVGHFDWSNTKTTFTLLHQHHNTLQFIFIPSASCTVCTLHACNDVIHVLSGRDERKKEHRMKNWFWKFPSNVWLIWIKVPSVSVPRLSLICSDSMDLSCPYSYINDAVPKSNYTGECSFFFHSFFTFSVRLVRFRSVECVLSLETREAGKHN